MVAKRFSHKVLRPRPGASATHVTRPTSDLRHVVGTESGRVEQQSADRLRGRLVEFSHVVGIGVECEGHHGLSEAGASDLRMHAGPWCDSWKRWGGGSGPASVVPATQYEDLRQCVPTVLFAARAAERITLVHIGELDREIRALG